MLTEKAGDLAKVKYKVCAKPGSQAGMVAF